MSLSIAHIINPVNAPPDSDLFKAQPITFETMRLARAFAQEQVRVTLYTTQYPEDHAIIPDFFTRLPDLKRSVLDVKSDFSRKKKYPLICDVLQTLYDHTEADYLIYTNADIALLPQFYLAIKAFIREGLDGMIINRRRVSRRYHSVEQIPLMFSELGRPHPGFDCFVFRRNLFPRLILGNVCIGVPFVEATLTYNLFAFCERCHLFTDKHLTMHIGLEVMPLTDKEYHQYNQQEFRKIYRQLRPLLSPEKLPYAALPMHKKLLRWALNPAVFILPNMEVEVSGWWERFKSRLNEIRWKLIEKS